MIRNLVSRFSTSSLCVCAKFQLFLLCWKRLWKSLIDLYRGMKFCDTLVSMALLLELCFDLFRVVDRYVDSKSSPQIRAGQLQLTSGSAQKFLWGSMEQTHSTSCNSGATRRHTVK